MAYTYCMRFAWDPEKENANRTKHGISFSEATELFSRDVDYLEIYDEAHSREEDRFIAIGPVSGRFLVVVYAEATEDVIRLISARLATRREIHLYRRYEGPTT